MTTMTEDERLAVAKEYRRRAELFRDSEEVLEINMKALKHRQDRIDPDTADDYERAIRTMIEIQLDLLEVQKSASYGERLRYERRAKSLESGVQFENSDTVRGL